MDIEKEIQSIKERNARVELDKAWETSIFRTISVGVLTYLVMISLMMVVKADRPVTSALIPTAGFILSTQSLPVLKKWWIDKKRKSK